MSKRFKVEAVVVGRKDFGEKDMIIDLFTKNKGKLRTLAKGIRKISSKRLGHLELGNYVKVVLYQGKTFAIITETEVIDYDQSLRSNPDKLGSLMFICELVNVLLPENEVNKKIFIDLLKTKKAISNKRFGQTVWFEGQLLKQLGYGLPDQAKQLWQNKKWKQAHPYLKKRIQEITETKIESLALFK
jgi:DNA repair protein RecO (recombination protein O)